jgi:hypothetical protein
MSRTRTARLLAATTTATAALATLATLTAAPAQADSIGVKDPSDTAHGSDLRSVEVTHGRRAITVVTTHTNLRRDPASGSGGIVYLDTDPADRGPEYAFSGGFFSGTDYALVAVEGFGRDRTADPVPGDHDMRIDYRDEQVRFRIARSTVGDPATVAVAVKVSGTRSDGSSSGLVDWLGEPRSTTAAVARG